jgi:hypothetical protein
MAPSMADQRAKRSGAPVDLGGALSLGQHPRTARILQGDPKLGGARVPTPEYGQRRRRRRGKEEGCAGHGSMDRAGSRSRIEWPGAGLQPGRPALP